MPHSVDSYARAHGFEVANLRDALDLAPGDIAYVTGSLLDDVGDESSDLDVYVLSSEEGMARRASRFTNEERCQQVAQRFGMFYVRVGSAELDVECHPLAKLEELLDALAAYQPADLESVRSSYAFLGRFEHYEALELLHRLRIAQPIAEEERFVSLRERLDDERYFLWNVTYNMILAQANRRGVERNLGRGDPENAYIMLCRRYDALVDASLFSRGLSLDRWKWRLHKLRSLEGTSLLDDYRGVYFDVERGDRLPEFVRTRLEHSDRIADGIRAHVGPERCIMNKP